MYPDVSFFDVPWVTLCYDGCESWALDDLSPKLVVQAGTKYGFIQPDDGSAKMFAGAPFLVFFVDLL